MRVAVIQMNSGPDVSINLKCANSLLEEAVNDGCKMAVLPENFALMSATNIEKIKISEEPGKGPIQKFLSDTSRKLKIWIVAGSIPLCSSDESEDRVYGACIVYDSAGFQQAIYRKIHLFDVNLTDENEIYRESKLMCPGDEPVSVMTPLGKIGLTICYDLRFPELFRQLIDSGVIMFTVPAAFTKATGEAHWHTLLRARAIENLSYVVAAGQYGEHPDGRSTYGHSLIVDPWGKILAEADDGDCFIAADIDPVSPQKLRSNFPVLDSRCLS
ncbi:MAG: acyltransferase [Gammaproteobacteria bacterium]|nr:acyltransferase [Gammaproteobacteria bacterium]|tara:strand:+ start:432 stop:1247 length:816 start_codon:yes stop_codon:yes gene_type:complete